MFVPHLIGTSSVAGIRVASDVSAHCQNCQRNDGPPEHVSAAVSQRTKATGVLSGVPDIKIQPPVDHVFARTVSYASLRHAVL